MTSKIKRLSWTELFMAEDRDPPVDKAHLLFLDDRLYEFWALGRNLIIAWTPKGHGMDLVVVPYYRIAETLAQQERKPAGAPNREDTEKRLQQVVSGSKRIAPEALQAVATLLDCTLQHIDLPFVPGREVPLHVISALVKRYSLTFVADRAVALFDAVGFSRFSPLEQATQLNSLSYSVNTAYSKLMDRKIVIQFARTTTGDGFYIWNRDRSIHANVDLYHFMHLVLADNAIALSKATGHTVPLLRTAFSVGGHYEFYQSEGLNPTTFSYIVGDVTIELARMLEAARPGQILVGAFNAPMFDTQNGRIATVDSVDFIHRAQTRLSSLNDLVLGGDTIEAIKCYLTGRRTADADFNISRFLVKDKHGFSRFVYNAKVNIHRRRREPIYLGLQESALEGFGSLAPEADTGT